MKKITSILAAATAAVMALSMAACGGTPAASDNPAGSGSASAEPVVLKLASQGAEGSLEIDTLNNFASLVNERSGGSLDVQVYPAGQLGALNDMIEGVTLGTIEMCAPGLSNLQQICNSFAAYDMWLYENAEDVINVYNSEIGKQLNQELIDTAGVRLLSYNNCSSGRLYLWSNVPIKTMADLNGLTIRVPGNKSIATALNAIGKTASIGFGDMYTAAQTGVIDVGSADISTMINAGFDEVFAYCNEITGNYMPLSLIISEDVFQSLTAEQQQIIEAAAVEACQYWDAHQDEVMQGSIDLLNNSKCEMVTMEPAELEKMDDLIHTAIEGYLSETVDPELIAQVRAITEGENPAA